MTQNRRATSELLEENKQLRAQVAQLEDRIDYLSSHGSTAKAVQQTEAFHREVMSVVSDAVLMVNATGRLKYVSTNAHLVFGHSPEDILKHGRVSFVLPKDLYDADVLEQRGEICNIECQIRDVVGRARNLLVTVRYSGKKDGSIMYVCRDVTERIKIKMDYDLLSLTMEQRIEQRTRDLRIDGDRYRRLVECLRTEYLFYATNEEGTITYVSPSTHSILGYTPDQVLGHNWREFVDASTPSFAELVKLEKLRFSGVETPPFTAWILNAKGEDRLFEFRDTVVRDSNGHVISNEGIGRDITERFRAEEKLRQARAELQKGIQEATAELRRKNEELIKSKALYKTVIQDHLEFIIRWREDGARTFVNNAYCRYWNLPAEELKGKSFMGAIVEDDKDSLREELTALTPDNPTVIHEHRTVKIDGSVRWERWTHRALFNAQREFIEYQSVGCDITEQRKREDHHKARDAAAKQLSELTKRERDVMQLVVAGDPNKLMARKLNLSIKTVEKHRSTLMKKLNVRSVPELVRLAMLLDEWIGQ